MHGWSRFPTASECMSPTTLVCGATREKAEELHWRNGVLGCVVLLNGCDTLLVLGLLEQPIPQGMNPLIRSFNQYLRFSFLCCALSVWYVACACCLCILLKDCVGGWDGFTGVCTLTALEKFKLTDETLLTSSTGGGLPLIRLPLYILLKLLACFII